MADSSVPITAGSGTPVDTQIPGDGTDHRQVVVLGSPSVQARVAEVDALGRIMAAVGGVSLTTPAITAMTAGTTYTTSCGQAGNVSFWIQGTNTSTTASVTLGNIVFEQSDDGVNWAPLTVVRSDNNIPVTSVSGGAIAAGAALVLDAALEGVNFCRARAVTAASAGTQYLHALLGGMPFNPSLSIANALPAGSNVIGTVTVNGLPNTTAKGTQASTATGVQDFKDAGRLAVTANLVAGAGITTEALTTLALNKGATASSTATPAVTSGKTFRIQSLTVSMRLGAAAVGWSRFALRTSFSSTAVTATSPILAVVEIGPGSAAVVGAVDRTHVDLPDGLELASTVSWGITRIGSATTNVESIALVGFEY